MRIQLGVRALSVVFAATIALLPLSGCNSDEPAPVTKPAEKPEAVKPAAPATPPPAAKPAEKAPEKPKM